MAVDTSGPETDDPFEPVDTTPVPLRPEQFFLGQQVDVLDSVDRWAEAGIGFHLCIQLLFISFILL